METHLRNVGRALIATGIGSALLAAILLMVSGGVNGVLGIDPDGKNNDIGSIPWQGLMLMALLVINFVMALPLFFAGRGILGLRPWARNYGIIITAVGILAFPISTGVCCYALWAIMAPESDPLFLNPPRARR